MKMAQREFVPMYALLAATHLFCRIFLLRPLLVSSAWLPLIGALAAAAPAVLCARRLMGEPQPLDATFDMALSRFFARAWYAGVAGVALLELKTLTGVYVATVVAYTADIVRSQSVAALTLLFAGLCAYMGELTLANSARLTLRLLALIMGAFILCSVKSAHMEYFFPLLGPGLGAMASEIPALSGILLMPLPFLFGANTCDPEFKRALPLSVAAAALLAALCLAIYTMALPTLPSLPATLAFRTAMLINNGDSGVQMQLPLIILWNACQLIVIAGMISLCGKMLKLIFPRLKKLCVPMVIAAEIAICLLWQDETISTNIAAAAYPLITSGFIAAAALYAARGKKPSAEPTRASEGSK